MLDQKEPSKKLAGKGAKRVTKQPDELKNRSGREKGAQTTSATTIPAQTSEIHVGPPTDHYSGQLANSGHTGTTPVMTQNAGKRDIREPETPSQEEEIREPNPDEQEAAAESREQSRKEAAIEENPPRDDEGKEAA